MKELSSLAVKPLKEGFPLPMLIDLKTEGLFESLP